MKRPLRRGNSKTAVRPSQGAAGEKEMFMLRNRDRNATKDADVAAGVQEDRAISVRTELGRLTVESSMDPDYPGFNIILTPDGEKHEILLGLAEVIKAENSQDGMAELHLRSWAAPREGMVSVDGVLTEGKISHEAPMVDIVLHKGDAEKYCSLLKEPGSAQEKGLTAEEALTEVLRQDPRLEEKDGKFTCCVPVSYGEGFSAETADRILSAEDPSEALRETVMGIYSGSLIEEENAFIDRAAEKLGPVSEDEKDWGRLDMRVRLIDILKWELPVAYFEDQEFNAVLKIDTGDRNYDYSLNHYSKGTEIDDRASLVWLAKTQGYSKQQLQHALDKGDVDEADDFLTSVRQEVANETTNLNCLAFPVRMKMKGLILLNRLIRMQGSGDAELDPDKRPDCGTVRLSRKVKAGLFDEFNGAGSLLGLILEKDIDIPIRYIAECLPDINRPGSFSLGCVFDMAGSAWKRAVLGITPPEKF